jgi:hypothetical protein
MPTVKKDALAEAIARKLSGFCSVPPKEQERMIWSVVRLCKTYIKNGTGYV